MWDGAKVWSADEEVVGWGIIGAASGDHHPRADLGPLIEPGGGAGRHVDAAVASDLDAPVWERAGVFAARTEELPPGRVVDVEAAVAEQQRVVDVQRRIIVGVAL